MRKYCEALRGLYAKAGKLPVTAAEIAEAIGTSRQDAIMKAAGWRRCGWIEPGPVKATYYIAVEMLPAPAVPPPPKAPKVKAAPRVATRDGQTLGPVAPRVMGQDWAVLDALDVGGPCTVRELRRRAATSFNVGPSLERLAAAGLVAADGLVWRAT